METLSSPLASHPAADIVLDGCDRLVRDHSHTEDSDAAVRDNLREGFKELEDLKAGRASTISAQQLLNELN